MVLVYSCLLNVEEESGIVNTKADVWYSNANSVMAVLVFNGRAVYAIYVLDLSNCQKEREITSQPRESLVHQRSGE